MAQADVHVPVLIVGGGGAGDRVVAWRAFGQVLDPTRTPLALAT